MLLVRIFGIALVEAQACGTPVIAYRGGGASEIVKDIRQDPETGTGLLFDTQQTKSIVEVVETFDQFQSQFNLENCRLQANKFSSTIFKKSYLNFLDQCCQEFHSVN